MGRIDMRRVVLGGLLAGVVFVVLAGTFERLMIGKEFEAALEALGKPMPDTAWIHSYKVV